MSEPGVKHLFGHRLRAWRGAVLRSRQPASCSGSTSSARSCWRRHSRTAPTIVHDLPFMASAIATIDAERQLIVAEDGLYVRDVKTGALTLHTALEADNPLTRSNDSRVHPSGAFWIGTMGKDDGAEGRRDLLVLQGRAAHALFRRHDPELDLLFARRRDRLFHRPDLQHHPCASTATRRPACRRGEPQIFVDTSGAATAGSTARWSTPTACCGTRAGAARASTPGRRTASSSARSPCRRSNPPARPSSARDASRIAVTSAWKGMDAAGARRRSRRRQDLPARHRGARPLRAARAV